MISEAADNHRGCDNVNASHCDENVMYWRHRYFDCESEICFVCGRKEIRVNVLNVASAEVLIENGGESSIQSPIAEASSDNLASNDISDELSVDLLRDNKLRKCSLCTVHFHEKCFLTFDEGDFVPLLNIYDGRGRLCYKSAEAKKWICPQHECNFCHQELLRTRSKLGSFIRCVECIFAWHRSCVIVGSHHIRRRRDKFILCPRHVHLSKSSRLHTPYCVKCADKFADGMELKCSTCVRAFCRCILKSEGCLSGQQTREDRSSFVCDYCKCADYPRIGDLVLAPHRKWFWPARTLHADFLPDSLAKQSHIISKLEQPGFVLIQWIECIDVPNYDVLTCRDLVPFPKNFECCIFKNLVQKHPKIFQAVKSLYDNGDVHMGINRPLPAEIELRAPVYTKIKKNLHGKLAQISGGDQDYCDCEPVIGEKCTLAHRCLNRSVLAECPADCGEHFGKPNKRNSTKFRNNRSKMREQSIKNDPHSVGVRCANNFLRSRDTQHDSLIMKEKPAGRKGFGVFAHKDIPKGTDLIEYIGEVIPKSVYVQYSQYLASFNNLELSYYGMQLTHDCYVDARHYGNMSRTFNHSCDPNCNVDPVTVDGIFRLKISTKNDVVCGEELCFDYATELIGALSPTPCYCGSKICRGTIGKRTSNNRSDIVKNEIDFNLGLAQVSGKVNVKTQKHSPISLKSCSELCQVSNNILQFRSSLPANSIEITEENVSSHVDEGTKENIKISSNTYADKDHESNLSDFISERTHIVRNIDYGRQENLAVDYEESHWSVRLRKRIPTNYMKWTARKKMSSDVADGINQNIEVLPNAFGGKTDQSKLSNTAGRRVNPVKQKLKSHKLDGQHYGNRINKRRVDYSDVSDWTTRLRIRSPAINGQPIKMKMKASGVDEISGIFEISQNGFADNADESKLSDFLSQQGDIVRKLDNGLFRIQSVECTTDCDVSHWTKRLRKRLSSNSLQQTAKTSVVDDEANLL